MLNRSKMRKFQGQTINISQQDYFSKVFTVFTRKNLVGCQSVNLLIGCHELAL